MFDKEFLTSLSARLRISHRDLVEADEWAAGVFHERTRALPQRLVDLAHEGRRVAAHTAAGAVCGRISHVGHDVFTIAAPAGDPTCAWEVHLRIDACVVEALDPQAEPDLLGSAEPARFVARLRQLELATTWLSLVGRHSGVLPSGRLVAVSTDHVLIEGSDARRWMIPLAHLAGVHIDNNNQRTGW